MEVVMSRGSQKQEGRVRILAWEVELRQLT